MSGQRAEYSYTSADMSSASVKRFNRVDIGLTFWNISGFVCLNVFQSLYLSSIFLLHVAFCGLSYFQSNFVFSCAHLVMCSKVTGLDFFFWCKNMLSLFHVVIQSRTESIYLCNRSCQTHYLACGISESCASHVARIKYAHLAKAPRENAELWGETYLSASCRNLLHPLYGKQTMTLAWHVEI